MKSHWLVWLWLVALPVSAAGVQKWTDAQGRVHYGDAAPTGTASTQLKLQSHSGAVEVERVPGAERPSASAVEVTLYSTTWCSVCRRAKAFLDLNHIPYREWDVENTSHGARKYRELKGTGVPLITVGDELMRGFSEKRFISLWERARRAP